MEIWQVIWNPVWSFPKGMLEIQSRLVKKKKKRFPGMMIPKLKIVFGTKHYLWQKPNKQSTENIIRSLIHGGGSILFRVTLGLSAVSLSNQFFTHSLIYAGQNCSCVIFFSFFSFFKIWIYCWFWRCSKFGIFLRTKPWLSQKSTVFKHFNCAQVKFILLEM